MATTNYKLPTITGNMAADVVRDMNALAEATDGAIKKAVDGVDLSTVTQQIGAVDQRVTTHLADDVRHLNYATTSGINTFTATIPDIESLVEGMSVKIKFTNANTGASTLNINNLGAKTVQKGNGNALSSGNIKAGQICHLVYTGAVFQLLGEGGEYGTAVGSDVLSGKTIGTENGLISGTIPSKSIATITPGTSNQTITAGQYLSGNQTILGDADLIPTNIKKGIDIFGVIGTVDITSLGGKKWATGTFIPTTHDVIEIRGLDFKPSIIITRMKRELDQFEGTGLYIKASTYGGVKDIKYHMWQKNDIYDATVNLYNDGFMFSSLYINNSEHAWFAFE